MKRAAVVAVLLIALCPLAAVAADDGLNPQAEQNGTFCTLAPAQLDQTVPAAVNALGVSVPDTPPIAVLDTGVDSSIPELRGRVVSPFDALGGNPDGSDLDGHGTGVAGLAAGAPGLVQGVSPTSPIMSIRVYNRYGDSSNKALLAGIKWAMDHGASVINISGATALANVSAGDVSAIRAALSTAVDQGILVVAALANDGEDQADFPASLPHVLAVGASDVEGTRATFSDTGPWVDLVAPAVALVAPTATAFCPSGYGVANGTSFAAPAAAAAGALLAKLRPQLTAEQRWMILRASARDLGLEGRDDETGFGMLDVQAAINAPVPKLGSSAEVDDDPIFVRGPMAAGHPTLLTRKRTGKVSGDVSPAKDPSDLYPIRLTKGERFVASAKTTKGKDHLLELAVWKPGVGDFDVSNGVFKQRIVSTGGVAVDPRLTLRVKETGTYFVSVEATDPFDEDDPEAAIPITEPYTLSLARAKIKVSAPAKAKKKTAKKK